MKKWMILLVLILSSLLFFIGCTKTEEEQPIEEEQEIAEDAQVDDKEEEQKEKEEALEEDSEQEEEKEDPNTPVAKEAEESQPQPNQTAKPEPKPEPKPQVEETSNEVDIVLYFMNKQIVETGNGDYNDMVKEVRTIKKDGRPIEELIVRELQKGPRGSNAQNMIRENITINSVSAENGIAYVDFSSKNLSGGSLEEIGITQQIIYSLTELDHVNQVQFLVDGAVRESLMGHGDASYPMGRF